MLVEDMIYLQYTWIYWLL